jgi:SNF2 family DNA or RNA helicase
MARLFSKDYHERSASWYFNHAVIGLDKGDLQHWKSVDEAGLYHMHFFPEASRREFFVSWVDVVYDPQTQTIRSHLCSECGEDDNCRHYLSVLRYAYHHLRTDIFDLPAVETCDGKALRAPERWQETIREAYLSLEGIYNPEMDKVRFYYDKYEPLDLPLLLSLQRGEAPEDVPEARLAEYGGILDLLTDQELNLFEYVFAHKAAHSAKSKFFSLSKAEFATVLGLLAGLGDKCRVRETGEPLRFNSTPYPLSLRIEPSGKQHYIVLPVIPEELSAFYQGYPAWLLFRNEVRKVYLPLANEVIRKLFNRELVLNPKDLIYYRTIVYQQLRRQDIYLDFDPSVQLPPIVSAPPRIRLMVKRVQDKIVLEGSLAYPGPGGADAYLVPLSVVRFGTPLIRSDYDDPEGRGNAWFYLPPFVFNQVKRLLEALPPAEFNRLEEHSQLLFAGDGALDDLRRALFELGDENLEIEYSGDLRSEFVYKVPLQVEISARRSEDIDWFSYDIRYSYKDFSFTHEELSRFFRSQEQFLHTQDGRIVFISNPEIFQETQRLLAQSERIADRTYRARMLNLPYYQRLMQENPSFRMLGDQWLQDLSADLLRGHLERTDPLPLYLQTVLRGYQKVGYAWLKMLAHYRLGGILADEMGLGKTIQALSAILSTPFVKRSLLVCPKTLLYNWAAEIEKFHTNISYQIIEGDKPTRLEQLRNPNARLFIISYTLVLNDIAQLRELDFEWLVLDEAQNIKNVGAQRTHAIKKLKADHRLALSGTPVENNLTELWSIMDFLMPGYLGTLKRFKQEYLDDPERGASRLHRSVAPFLLRRVKKEVLLELPDKQEQVSWCRLHPVQEKLYLQILDLVQKKLLPAAGSSAPNFVHILAALTKLRQVCNHPHLANEDILPELGASAKLEQLVELVEDSIESGHKILVFSQFVQMLKIIRGVFDGMGLAYAYLDGRSKNRLQEVNRFEQDPDLKLFLISLKTGGYGLNLTSADTVILFDPWWNPMVENQAIDRTHRLGQTRKVQVFRLIAKGTVEEKIMNLQQGKIDLFDAVVSDGQKLLSTLSEDDIRSLFSYDDFA